MKRIATPMIGGIVTSGILELLIYPVIYVMWRKRELPDQTEEKAPLVPQPLIPSGWLWQRMSK
jgi:Cu(I)/Ag(I) efflux system membrane protein CusA/SilA